MRTRRTFAAASLATCGAAAMVLAGPTNAPAAASAALVDTGRHSLISYNPTYVPPGSTGRVRGIYTGSGATVVTLHVWGLVPNREYGAHAHKFGCSATDPMAAGGHTGAESQFGAAPLDPQLRTLATGLGVLLGPTSVASALTLGVAYAENGPGPPLEPSFSDWEYLHLPLTWLGAGLLGLAVARWLPWPGVPLAVFVGLVAWTMWSAHLMFNGRWGGFLMPYVIASQDVVGLGTSSPDGHPGWHAVYLLGLCLLALAAALLRHRPLRERAMLGFGVLAAVLTASAAWLQLP